MNLRGKARDYHVLFIISDQHRRGAMGCSGHPQVRTPHLDSLARDGVRFTQAYCPAPLSGPSRAAINTGVHVHTSGAFTHATPIHKNLPTLAESFRSAGFATGSIGKMHVVGESKERDLGYDHRSFRYYGYEAYRDYINAVGVEKFEKYNSYFKGCKTPRRDAYNAANKPIELEESEIFDSLVVDHSLQFMEKHRSGKFFLWVGLEKPHPELLAPAQYHAMYDPKKMVLPESFGKPPQNVPDALIKWYGKQHAISEEMARGYMAAYFANVSYLDASVGRLLAGLDRLNIRDNTLIVYTSDHGEMLLDHSLLQKHCHYEGSVGVPLLMANKNLFPANSLQTGITGLIDLFPTLMDLQGLDAPAGLEGKSLLERMEGKSTGEDGEALSEFYGRGQTATRMLRRSKWKYIHTHGEMPQLYDLEKDPGEMTNLARVPSMEKVKKELEERVLRDWEIPTTEDIQKLSVENPET